jgi:hypothetical protein
MHKLIKLSFLFIILLFLFSTYSQSETDKPTRENINIDSDFFKFKEALTKNQSKSTKKWFQPRDFKFLIPLAILFFAVISGMRSIESAKKKNKLSESKKKPKRKEGLFASVTKGDPKKEPIFGVDFRKITENEINPDAKPIVTYVTKNGPCHNKLEIGDLILTVNGISVKTVEEFFAERAKIKPGTFEFTEVQIERQGNKLTKYISIISLSEFNNKLKHEVYFNIQMSDLSGNHKCTGCGSFYHNNPSKEPRITFVQAGGLADQSLEIDDLICTINGVSIKTVSDFDNERKKLKWGEKVIFVIERKGKVLTKSITPISHEDSLNKEMCPTIDIEVNNKKEVIIRNIYRNVANDDLKKNDVILSVNSKKIKFIQDWFRELSKVNLGKKIHLKIKRGSKKIKCVLELFSFSEYLTRYKKLVGTLFGFNQKKVELFMKEFAENDYTYLKEKRIKEIQKMDLKDEAEEEDYTDDDYSYEDEGYDEEKIYLTTTVKKEKVVGKESFVLNLEGFPDDERLETLTDGKKIFLKIYVFDVTDLDSDKYNKILDDIGMTDQYFSNHCHVIKTNEITWSDGNMNLIQSKELEPYGDHPTKLAFPYSVMQLPKVGKRRLSFRTFVCTDKQKFDDAEGRPKDGESINYRPESFKMDDYAEYGFDDYGDYPEILSYTSSEIEVEYKQPGYLDINRRKYNDLTIALGLTLNQLEGKNLKKNFEKIKDEIRYDGDSSAENNVYKSLSLKANYERTLNKKIDLESILKELKKNSRIHERYEMIDLLLNLAITDQTYSAKENEFIDKVAKTLDLHNEKFQEIKKQKTASVKFVDFGDKADESIFGITKDMDKKEKLRVLRKEYSRWNALTNNSDKAIRERAREMRDLAANIRKQYT